MFAFISNDSYFTVVNRCWSCLCERIIHITMNYELRSEIIGSCVTGLSREAKSTERKQEVYVNIER